jgi:hypothetical protein
MKEVQPMVSKLRGRKLTKEQLRNRAIATADNWLKKHHKLTREVKSLPPAMRILTPKLSEVRGVR